MSQSLSFTTLLLKFVVWGQQVLLNIVYEHLLQHIRFLPTISSVHIHAHLCTYFTWRIIMQIPCYVHSILVMKFIDTKVFTVTLMLPIFVVMIFFYS